MSPLRTLREKMMKRVLLTTYPHAFLHRGGGEREIHLLREALNLDSVQADIYGPSSHPLHTYQDIIHFSMMGGSELLLNEINKTGGQRMILWPNLWFVEEPDTRHLESLTSFLNNFDAVVFKSKAEEVHFRSYFDLAGKDVIRISPLVSPRFSQKDISTVFRESYGLRRYALWTGIIEPQKNQLQAVKAFSGLDIDMVFSGDVRDEAYVRECKKHAAPNIHFIHSMPFGSELHLSALAYCSLYVELPMDFPGTSAIEAQALGCRLLLTRSSWTEEMLSEFALLADPENIEGIRAKAINLLTQPEVQLPCPKVVEMTDVILPLVEYLQHSNAFTQS